MDIGSGHLLHRQALALFQSTNFQEIQWASRLRWEKGSGGADEAWPIEEPGSSPSSETKGSIAGEEGAMCDVTAACLWNRSLPRPDQEAWAVADSAVDTRQLRS